MTPEITAAFDAVKARYGAASLDRVEAMMAPGEDNRAPLQRDTKWILPGISQKPWHDPYEHPEIATVVRAFEGAHKEIKDELTAAWTQRGEVFSPYQHYLMQKQDWRALYLYRDAALVPEAEAVTPAAFRVLNEHAVRTGLVCPLLESHFSTLLPGAEIAPHCDLWNFSINLHVAIDIPDGCAIDVAGEIRNWEEGHCLLFDYSFRHSAWNHGDRPRTCLLVDLWHPETTVPEREALTVLITEIRALFGDG
ncbi:aspartyl/asparaginyl beta-hydroxylase domain-containing protein [Streptomyces goshikiensis]|uniref:aspartyl/asparaginyl beta-hydroxylase domain-containing protein n=1 Tax=Streptomyces goshikiensis TaxID=1942 RepID=UPI0036BC886C